MYVATVAPGYVNKSEAFDTEREALAWVEREMRAAGTKNGIVYEIEGEL